MIHTEHGRLKINGKGEEVCGDLYVILSESIKICPRELFFALDKFANDLNDEIEEEKEEMSEDERAMAAALMLALLPEAEREKLKKKTEEE